MKWKKVIAERAPKPHSKSAPKLGIVAAGIMIIMALVQLVRFDKFLPELDVQLPGGYGFAVFVGAVVVFTEIFAIPFLLRMKLSRLARSCSGLLALIPAWIWLLISIWSTGNGYVAVEFSTYCPFDTNWLTIVFNVMWLAFNFYVVWQLGLGEILSKKPKTLKKTTK